MRDCRSVVRAVETAAEEPRMCVSDADGKSRPTSAKGAGGLCDTTELGVLTSVSGGKRYLKVLWT